MASIVGLFLDAGSKARAIERYLHNEGHYLTENTDWSRLATTSIGWVVDGVSGSGESHRRR